MNNKYKLYALFIVILVFLNTSCIIKLPFLFLNNNKKTAGKRFEQILLTIKNKDKDSLKAIFSKKAIEESKQIDDNIIYLFSLLEDDVVSWEENGVIVDYSYNNGHKKEEIKSFFNIYTEKNKYLVFILDYPRDTEHPENAGLYSLRVIKAENEKTQFTHWQDMVVPGVYRPGENTPMPDEKILPDNKMRLLVLGHDSNPCVYCFLDIKLYLVIS